MKSISKFNLFINLVLIIINKMNKLEKKKKRELNILWMCILYVNVFFFPSTFLTPYFYMNKKCKAPWLRLHVVYVLFFYLVFFAVFVYIVCVNTTRKRFCLWVAGELYFAKVIKSSYPLISETYTSWFRFQVFANDQNVFLSLFFINRTLQDKILKKKSMCVYKH